MKLSKKMKEFLNHACLAKFHIDFDTMYHAIEESEKQKELLKQSKTKKK